MNFIIYFRSPESNNSFRKVLRKPERLLLNIFKEKPISKEIFQSNLKKARNFLMTINI